MGRCCTNGCWSAQKRWGFRAARYSVQPRVLVATARMHEEAFFELAADLPMELEFVLSEQQATQVLKLLKDERLQLFYIKLPAEYGVIDVDG